MASTAAVLNILVAANTAPASAQLTALSGQLKATSTQAGATSTAIGSGLSKNAKIGAAGMAAAGVAAIAVGKALISSVKAASDFESSFAEVRKTVDTNEQGFKNIERGLRNLAKRIPISVHELNNLAGEAGALGIKSKDIIRFTEVAAKLGTTTNLSSSEAANALARLSNIMGSSSKDFKNLASTLVGLGNAGASTEAEIAEMALRIAGTGKQVGLSEAQVLGFASALASVGINAEAGGSAISRAFSLMSEAVATSNEDLAKFAEVADMSAPAFGNLFEKDASKAMLAFTDGLSKSKNAIATLADLDINDVRLRDALLRAAGASQLFREQLGLANQEFRDGKALDEEAQKRYDTFAAKVQTLKNRFYDLKITLGNELLPVLSDFVGELNLAFAQIDGTSKRVTTLGNVLKTIKAILDIIKAPFSARGRR
jgi:TP901 family phage tail tape measure protein